MIHKLCDMPHRCGSAGCETFHWDIQLHMMSPGEALGDCMKGIDCFDDQSMSCMLSHMGHSYWIQAKMQWSWRKYLQQEQDYLVMCINCPRRNCSRSGNLEIIFMISMKLWSCKIIWMQKHGKWFFSTAGFPFLCNNTCNCIIIIQTKLDRTSSIIIHSTTPLDQKLSLIIFTDKAFY